MAGDTLGRRGIWDADRSRGVVSNRVGVGDRVARLSNGRAVGTVTSVDNGGFGPGFTVLLDEPTTRQWDKTGGVQRYEGLAAGNLFVSLSAQQGHGGQRDLGFDAATLTLRDAAAADEYLMAMEIEGERAIWAALGLIEEEA